MLTPALSHIVAMSPSPRSASARTERSRSAGGPRTTSSGTTSHRTPPERPEPATQVQEQPEAPSAKKRPRKTERAAGEKGRAAPREHTASAPTVRKSSKKAQGKTAPRTPGDGDPVPRSGAAADGAGKGTTGTVETGGERDHGHLNEVVAVGRVTAAPTERDLPSGDRLVFWRICVARPSEPHLSRQRVDSLTLVSFDADTQAAVRDWRIGDVVRVTGALRRRVWRGWSGIRSVLEVEVDSTALVRGAQR
ncbi:single-stranded DNA-binding protein [Nocardiopsis oceani]